MCRPASFVVTRNRVYWGWSTESHTEIVAEHNLRESNVRGEMLFVRVEVSPDNCDYMLPLQAWTYRVDQDILPLWYDKQSVERRVRTELRRWAKAKLHKTGIRKRVQIGDYNIIVCGGTVQEVCGGTVEAVCGGTVQKVWDGTVHTVHGGVVHEVGGGTVEKVLGGIVHTVHGGAVHEVCGGTVEKVYGGVVHEVYGGTVYAVYGGTVEKVWDGTVHTVYGGMVQRVWGGTIQKVCGGAVERVYGGTVQEVHGGTVQAYVSINPGILMGVSAVLIDRTSVVPVCHVGRKVNGER